MRTRLASLIVVKQEPLTNEYLDESEQNALIVGQTNYNEVDTQYFGLTDRHRDILPTSIQSIGDLNNNNSNYVQPDEFIEDKKCTYRFWFFSFSRSVSPIVSSCEFWFGLWAKKKNKTTLFPHSNISIRHFDTSANTISIFKCLINTFTRYTQSTHSLFSGRNNTIFFPFFIFVYYKFLLTFRFLIISSQ